jgi:hypothetical protein
MPGRIMSSVVIARLLLFPILYLGNRWGRGNCLPAVAAKPQAN